MGVSRVRVDGVCQRCHGAACQMSSGSARGGTVWVIKGKEEERRWLSFSYGLSLLKWSYTYSFATTKLTKRLLWRANWADRDDLCSNPHGHWENEVTGTSIKYESVEAQSEAENKGAEPAAVVQASDVLAASQWRPRVTRCWGSCVLSTWERHRIPCKKLKNIA